VSLPNAADFTAGLWAEGNPVLPGHVAAYGVLYNTERTPNPPTSWAELAEVGGIGVPDPNASSGMVAFLYALDQIMGEEYLPELVGGVALVTESGTALPQLVMTGEVDFSTPTVPQFLAGLLEQGEPAGLMFMSEGTPVVPTGLATFVDAPHPNAGQLLAQYAVSCEFQKHMVETGSISVLSYLPIPQPEGANELTAADLVPINDIDALAERDSLLQRFNDAKG
jgi:ABC-type Fe3+ transport system substrate-binding protein